MIPIAHIAGIPVEETIGMFGPAATVFVGAVGATIRMRWSRLRGARQRLRRPTSDSRAPTGRNGG